MSEKRLSVLSLCATCKYAAWQTTSNGRRHPNGDGKCLHEPPDAPLSKVMEQRSWRGNEILNTVRTALAKYTGSRHISWRDYHAQQPCATWEPKA